LIIAIVVLELVVCLLATLLIAVGNLSDSAIIPLQTWLVCGILQLLIAYLPHRRYVEYWLALLVATALVSSFAIVTHSSSFYPQSLFIASIAVIPQLWWQRFFKGQKGVLGLVTLAALPLGVLVWSCANIGIVKFQALRVTEGEPYCILVSSGKISTSGYRQLQNDWKLSGTSLFSSRGAGGSGNCCQWDFHALLLTRNKGTLYNWSYKSQRFEKVTDRSRSALYLNGLNCQQ
jgi:hypothetical protein